VLSKKISALENRLEEFKQFVAYRYRPLATL
jgi:hypothetical protein